MAKVYTAQEMREIANALSGDNEDLEDLVIADADYGLHINHNKTFEIASMLRQAADALECEENRKKEYEYAISYHDTTDGKRFIGVHYTSIKDAEACSIKHKDIKKTYVRREVGKWEEVKE